MDSSVDADEVVLRLYFRATYTGNTLHGVSLFEENFGLRPPDGTSIAPDHYVSELLDDPSVAIGDVEVRFKVPAPSAGKYVPEVGGWWSGKNNYD